MPSPERFSSGSSSPAEINRRHLLRGAVGAVAAFTAGTSSRNGLQAAESGGATASMIQEPARDVPVADDVDVIVCGGGPAGVTAAITAARAGARVRLFEVHGCLGGVWTAGLLSYVLDADKPGFNTEIVRRLQGRDSHTPNTGSSYFYDPEEMKLLLEELCVESGVKTQLFTRVVATQKDASKRLTTIITESKAGRQAWRARVFIDATGDGDVGALAGCEWETGERNQCPCQPLTMMAMVTAPDAPALRPFASHYGQPSWRKEPVENLRQALAQAGLKASYGTPSLFHVRDRLFNLMINHEYSILAYDAPAVTEATFRARAEINRVVRGLRKLGGPWEGFQLVATAEQIGVRDGRRIIGRYVLTKEDLIEGRKQDDGAVRATFNVDIHAATKEHNEKAAFHSAGVKTKPYDIPLRAMIARDVDALMMAGRCISGDFIAHASYRVTGNAVAMGEATGVVAAMAAQSKVLPHAVDWKEASPLLEKIRGGELRVKS
ncbi:MAG TPA: FAD-dependent oxidoreductase [Verrucomicrobium sp.]|nr:FAD-dependent oxidoreductase [Verrucomicrobium sp.]